MLGVFTETSQKLERINGAIQKEEDTKTAKILALQQELTQLGTQRTRNANVIGKIENLLS